MSLPLLRCVICYIALKNLLFICVCVAALCVKFIGFTWLKYLVFVDLQSINILYINCRYISNPSP